MMADQTESLFVYGTLKPGFGNHRRIANQVHSAHPGAIQGILVDLGAFPALILGPGRVRGVLLSIDPQALTTTDFIEGYHADREQSLYLRDRVEVDLGDGEIVEAWTYFIAHPHRYEDRPHLIAGETDGIPIHCWPAE